MLNYIQSKLQTRYFLDFGNYKNTVLVAGTGRSGTTWIQDVINQDGSYRTMFEPFHSKKIGLLKSWNYRQYLRVNDKNPKYLKPAATILGGKIRDPWIDQFNTKILTNKRLIKDIRINLFLKWIKLNFPEIPIVLLFRHPCAVASSKLVLGWETHLDDFLSNDELVIDFLAPYKKDILSAKNPFEKHIFAWCIENYVPLNQFSPGEILVIFYENLCLNPTQNMHDISEFLGLFRPVYSSDIFSKPSIMSREDSAIMSQSNPVENWRKYMGDQQIRKAVEILSLFGMEKVYNDENLPLLSANEALELFSV